MDDVQFGPNAKWLEDNYFDDIPFPSNQGASSNKIEKRIFQTINWALNSDQQSDFLKIPALDIVELSNGNLSVKIEGFQLILTFDDKQSKVYVVDLYPV